MTINLKGIAKAINENRFAPKQWAFESISHVDTKEYTTYGKLVKYEVVVRIKAGKYEDNAITFQVNHYVDEDSYTTYYDGSFYLD